MVGLKAVEGSSHRDVDHAMKSIGISGQPSLDEVGRCAHDNAVFHSSVRGDDAGKKRFTRARTSSEHENTTRSQGQNSITCSQLRFVQLKIFWETCQELLGVC